MRNGREHSRAREIDTIIMNGRANGESWVTVARTLNEAGLTNKLGNQWTNRGAAHRR
jgi:hypothetical protein